MNPLQASEQPARQRLLVVVHCFDADYSMESRLSWIRANQAAEHHDTTVICAEPFADVHCDVQAQIPGLKIVTVAHTPFEKALIQSPIGFYLAYRLWHKRVMKVAARLHQEAPFQLAHQLSYCGYREPGYCWQLGIPFVWGPIGGTQNVPWRFLGQLDPVGAAKEFVRSIINSLQLSYGLRVGAALNAARAVFVANREAQESFRDARGVDLPCQLETGLHDIKGIRRPLRDTQQPLRVLWTGRLESWKALPLLLKAVAQLPHEVPVELRVLGSGSRESRWKRLAEKLGISNRIQWVPLPEYGARDEHYEWADVLAFTSLRDTSGTGLLEALAAAVPIVGLNHQGARDIMTPESAIPIPVQTPNQVVRSIVEALAQLAGDPNLLKRLSAGAIRRAEDFRWETLGAEMISCYNKLLDESRPTQKRLEADEQLPEPALSLSPRVTA